MTACGAVLDHSGESCERFGGHTGYHRGSGGAFGPWVGPARIVSQRSRDMLKAARDAISESPVHGKDQDRG